MRAGGHEDLVQGEASEQRDLPGTSGRWQSGDYARREPGAFADFQKMLLVGGRRQHMTMARVEDFNVLSGAAEAGQRVNIDAYDETGFVVDGVNIRGAIVCFGNSTFRWNVSSMADVTPDSLAVFEAIRPAPELLVLGCGSHMVPVSKEVRSFLRKHGIGLEPESTANAAGTFNVLNEEGRKVAAALLPATEIR